MLSTFWMKYSKGIATWFLLSSPSMAAQVGIQDEIGPIGEIIPARALVRRASLKIQGTSLLQKKTEQGSLEAHVSIMEHYDATAEQEMATTASLVHRVRQGSREAQRELRRRSQNLHVRSQLLDYKMRAHAEGFPSGATLNFLRTLRLCAPCKMYKRFGEDNDGGYVMCADGLNDRDDGGLVGAYSIGINGFDGWGMAIASYYGIPLNEYDCTSSKSPVACKGCDVKFHSECILDHGGDAAAAEADMVKGLEAVRQQKAIQRMQQAQNGIMLKAATTSNVSAASFKTLTQILKESGNANTKERSLLLKIDVESAEWKVFAEEPIENLRKFREIAVEYHDIHKVEKHDLYLQAVRKIEQAGFAVTHMHGNNFAECMGSLCGPVVFNGKYSIPDVIEVTYIQKPAAGCAANIPYKSPLDMPNSQNPDGADMADAVLPQVF